ncbi:hypothetical protein OHC33_007998 [Knufia fluminis]|uniref:LOV domain-containing protein n=1 Tax=Knufia fluminis TaxID=191047 RepID=A0AAN8ENW8_9EURO|nr:hypothetical protein OHC33_007998 [Knufia fluminis]
MDRPISPEELEDLRRLDFDLAAVDEEESYAPSIDTQHTQHTSATGSSSSRIADFFGPEVFQVVLHNPTTAHQLKKFAHSRLCGENLEFLEKVDQYHQSLNQAIKTVFEIHRNFISVDAPNQVNLPNDVTLQINRNLKHVLAKVMPNMESVFLTAQHDIQRLVASDIYPRFVRYQMTSSVTRALATNKNKYAGLGDCFVLTDPNKGDNPIVYASDGFVKVTGYERNEIIPRNCRFLQTRKTDRESVTRIKKSLENPAECVELLLNERKHGEPFWNLLYTAPLYDSAGKLAFFLGGQINVSTTIHNTSDILRILSHGSDDEKTEQRSAPAPPKPARSSLWSSLRRSKQTNGRIPGMESDLLEDLNNMSFKQQKDAFYTAYSKYIIVNAETLLISFFSAGIVELLYPARATNQHSQIPGQEVFKFLSQHSSGNLSRDYKSRVRAAVKAGQAITLDLSLCTRRMMGFETFMTHWTPLKNDQHVTGFVVLTLGSLQDARRD